MSTKSQGSKRNKHKSRQSLSISHSAGHNSNHHIIASPGGQSTGDSTSFQSPTSLSSIQQRHSSMMSSSSTLNHDAATPENNLPGLEDLDHDDEQHNSAAQPLRSLSKKQRQQTQQQHLQQKEAEARVQSDLWTWITSSRVVPERHFDLTYKDSDTTESKKKSAIHLWDKANIAKSFDMSSRDWTMLMTIMVATLGVRFWRISWPDEVVLDEAHVGKAVNAYLKDEFMFDVHPPLGKLILAGVASLSNYNGSFEFDEIGDPYAANVPFISLRMTMAVMGALCSPLAYATLKVTGQGASAAIVAATLVAFDNALEANNRLILLDAPLLFFTAATALAWNMFTKQSYRPFSAPWWAWLSATGIAMVGAMSVKLVGVLSLVVIGLFSSLDLLNLARDDSVKAKMWARHFGARVVSLVILPAVLYLALFQVHFSYQTGEPDYRNSVQADIDVSLLSPEMRFSLRPKYAEDREEVWRDVVYGSVVQLKNENKPLTYLHSFLQFNPGGSGQQQTGGYEYPDLNTHWIVIRADMDVDDPEEIPSRIQYLKNGDYLRLRHVPTRRCLHSHDWRVYTDKGINLFHEVSAYGGPGFDGDSKDWWMVEIIDPSTMQTVTTDMDNRKPVRAFETMFRLKHVDLGCHLFASDSLLPEPWGQGRKEMICRSQSNITPKSIWRINMNDHDYLPMDTPLASYPKPTFLQKFMETHRLMWSHSGLIEKTYQPAASKPLKWPIAQSFIPAWVGYHRQITIVPNPVVWWTSALGLIVFIGGHTLFRFREKRGFFETGLVRDFKNFHLGEAGGYFVSWAVHYVPFFFVPRTLFIHHYFPALYFSILVSSSVLTGLAGFLPQRKMRFGLLVGLILFTAAAFLQIAPLSYGSSITREHCESLNGWTRGGLGSIFKHKKRLDCSSALKDGVATPPLWKLREEALVAKRLMAAEDARVALTAAAAASKKNAIAAAAAAAAAAVNREDAPIQPTGSDSSEPSTARDFLTTAAAGTSVASNLVQDGVRVNSVHSGVPRVPRPEPKLRSPILPMHFPPASMELAMQHLFLTPYQTPPQLWDMNPPKRTLEKGQPNDYQRQQLHEQRQQPPRQQEPQVQESPQAQEDPQAQENPQALDYPPQAQEGLPVQEIPQVQEEQSPQVDKVVDALPVNEDSEQELENLLDEYQARAAPHGKPKQPSRPLQERKHDPEAVLNYPIQFESRLDKKDEPMIDPEGVKQASEPEVSGDPEYKELFDKEKQQIAKGYEQNGELDSKLSETVDNLWKEHGPKPLSHAPVSAPSTPAVEEHPKERQERNEGDTVPEPPLVGVGAEAMRGDIIKSTEPKDLPSSQDPVESHKDDDRDDDLYDEDEGDDEDEDEDDYEEDDDEDKGDGERAPPIAVKNAEELASVLDRLAAEGLRAEVVRGTATRYVEPPAV